MGVAKESGFGQEPGICLAVVKKGVTYHATFIEGVLERLLVEMLIAGKRAGITDYL